MFARRVVNVELGAADHLLRVVEFVRLRRMADVAGMDHERRLVRHRHDLVDRRAERDARIRVGGLGEADVAVGDLDEGKAAFRCFRRADQARSGHAAGDRPNDAGSGPEHAFQGLPAVEPAFVIVRHDVSPSSAKSAVQRRGLEGGAVYSRVAAQKLGPLSGRVHSGQGRAHGIARRLKSPSIGELKSSIRKTAEATQIAQITIDK